MPNKNMPIKMLDNETPSYSNCDNAIDALVTVSFSMVILNEYMTIAKAKANESNVAMIILIILSFIMFSGMEKKYFLFKSFLKI